MKLLKQIPEAAMVAAFLKAEIFSPRFGEDVRKAMQSFGVDDAIITHPDITNDQENELRARVLGECRGYRQNREMFEGVPTNLRWYEAKLSHNEIGDLRYVDYSYWNALTDGTHLVKDGVRNIQKGKVVFDVPNDRFLMLAEAIRNGKYDFEPIILWGQNIDSPLEILEGHLRTTAFALAGDTAPAVMKVLVGLIEVPLISLTE